MFHTKRKLVYQLSIKIQFFQKYSIKRVFWLSGREDGDIFGCSNFYAKILFNSPYCPLQFLQHQERHKSIDFLMQ